MALAGPLGDQRGPDLTHGSGTPKPLRWGFVGTGAIAGEMAGMLATTPFATLEAVASRRVETARQFARQHGVDRVFDDWRDMLHSDCVDAVYIAIPTRLREAVALASANAGRHVLCEKPFTNGSSLQRITGACRDAGVAFMDATHFVHHPRHTEILDRLPNVVGEPRRLKSKFLLNLTDRDNIRYNPSLEPLGALGDLGWYNLRATVEYLAPSASPRTLRTSVERDAATGAITRAEGTLEYENGAISEWQCSFTAAEVDIGLTLEGPRGRLRMDNFVGDDDGVPAFWFCTGDGAGAGDREFSVPSPRRAAALMFDDFARAAEDASLRDGWMRASERTQALLDAAKGAGER